MFLYPHYLRQIDYKIDESAICHFLPELPELETEDIQVFHWNIKDWKSLDTRSHGPVFKAGGYPW